MAATTWYILHTPHALARLQSEIRGAFLTYADITATRAGQLRYLQAVIQEGLRIFPPGSRGFPRTSLGVEVTGHYVPPGTELYTSGWTLTHDEKNFHDPFAFLPERWIDRECKDLKEASQPFAVGPRGCIGKK